MNILDQIRALNEVDLANLDFENVGSWPGPLRVLLAIPFVKPTPHTQTQANQARTSVVQKVVYELTK